MNELLLIFGRFVSSLGSLLTSATVLLFLVASGREREIPINALAVTLGSIFASRVIVPRLATVSTKTVLMAMAAIGGVLDLAAASAGLFAPAGNAIYTGHFIWFLSFVFSALGITSMAVAHASLGDARNHSRMVHLDSSLQTLCRLISPGIAAILLLQSGARLHVALLVDGLTYVIALIIFQLFLRSGERLERQPSREELSFVAIFKQRPSFWAMVLVTALGASAYNAGAVVHLKNIGLGLEGISVFMTSQNAAMVAMGFALVHWTFLGSWRGTASVLASLGLLVVALGKSVIVLSLGAALLAVGMVMLIQGFRATLATSEARPALKRAEQAWLATVNSTANMLGIVLFTTISVSVAWTYLLIAGAAILCTGGLIAWGGMVLTQSSGGVYRAE